MKKYFPVIIHCLIIHSLVYSNDFNCGVFNKVSKFALVLITSSMA